MGILEVRSINGRVQLADSCTQCTVSHGVYAAACVGLNIQSSNVLSDVGGKRGLRQTVASPLNFR